MTRGGDVNGFHFTFRRVANCDHIGHTKQEPPNFNLPKKSIYLISLHHHTIAIFEGILY